MILHSIRVANWKCLSQVQIGPLTPGITIIHAPNKTGKSSLVEAVKLALVDFHYDTGQIKKFIPWRCSPDDIPGVAIEFLVKDGHYLMEKIFSKKAGGASLSRLKPDGTKTVIAEGKEVTGETQKLLGMSASKYGIPSLLWVEQGSVGMPAIDDEMGKLLRPMLGAILTTESDNKVRENLDDKMREWFTGSNIRKKAFFASEFTLTGIDMIEINEKAFQKNCDLSKLKENIDNIKRELEEINIERNNIDRDMGDAERLKHDLLKLDTDIKQAEKEVEELTSQDEKITEKREKARELEDLIDDTKKELSRLKEEKESFANSLNELIELEKDLKEKSKEFDSFKDARDSAKASYDSAKSKANEIEKQLGEMESTRSLLEAKNNIIEMEKEITGLGKTLEKALQFENKIKEHREELNSIAVPNKKDAKKVRKSLEERDKLQAELEASQLVLSISPNKKFSAKLKVDSEDEQNINFRKGEELVKNVRQKFNLNIPEWGVINVKRGQEDEDIEKLASRQNKTLDTLRGMLAPLGIDHEAGSTEIIAEIEKRSQKSKDLNRRIEEMNNDLDELAPQGIETLKAEKDRLENNKANIISSRKELKGWEPSKKSLREDQKEFKEAENKIKEDLAEAKRKLNGTETELNKAQSGLDEISGKVSEARIKFEVKKEEAKGYQEKYGSIDKMHELISLKGKEIEKKEREYEKYKLTEEEENIRARLEGAREARIKRIEHKGEISNQLAAVEERLKKIEGLHSRKNALEQTLAGQEQARERLEMTIKAHCTLLVLFDRIRDENIESSLKPVSEQMDRWIRELYGEDAKQIIFGSDLHPEKIVTDGGESKDFAGATSYGELEQLSTLVRLAYGVAIAEDEPQVVILDDPIAHSDSFYHRKMLTIIEDACKKNLQVLILTCEPEAFDHIKAAERINLDRQLGEVCQDS